MILDAITFATHKHRNQKDDTGKPYILHCMQVGDILRNITADEEIIAAGILHDTLEDTDCNYEELERFFGGRVANLVFQVTKEGDQFPYLVDLDAILIKFADRLSNLSRMEPWSDDRKQAYIKSSKFWKGGDI